MAREGGGAKEFVVVVNRPEGQRNERERERERWIGISFDFHQKNIWALSFELVCENFVLPRQFYKGFGDKKS